MTKAKGKANGKASGSKVGSKVGSGSAKAIKAKRETKGSPPEDKLQNPKSESAKEADPKPGSGGQSAEGSLGKAQDVQVKKDSDIKRISYAIVTEGGKHFGQEFKEGDIIRDRHLILNELMPKKGAPVLDNCLKIKVYFE